MAINLLQVLGIRRPLLGVDIGSTAVKVVRLGYDRRGPVLRYAGLTELVHTEEESGSGGQDRGAVMALYEMFREGRLRRQKMAVSYTGKSLIVRYLMLPKMPRDEIKEAIRWEAKKLVPQPLEQMILDYLIVGETEERDLKRYEILLIVAERESVLSQLEGLKPFRSQIAAMDVNPLALFNAVKLNYPSDLEENLVFVDIGAHQMTINISKRGILRFTRSVQLGGEDITKALMQALRVEYHEAEQMKRQRGLTESTGNETDGHVRETIKSEADRMILEIQRSVDYYRAQFREGGIRKVIVMGGTPLMPGFKDYFSSYFDAAVVLDNPFAGIQSDHPAASELMLMAPRFSTGVGLALRKVGE
jgi:type IV pilus assembly protein PilM